MIRLTLVALIATVILGPSYERQEQPVTSRVTHAPVPRYPSLVWAAGLSGDVVLSVSTGDQSVESVEVVENTLEGPFGSMLSAAAEENVRAWRFEQHERGTFLVNFRYRVTDSVSFRGTEVVTMRLPGSVEINSSRGLGAYGGPIGVSCGDKVIASESASPDRRYVVAIAHRDCEGADITEVLLREASGIFDSPPVFSRSGDVDIQLSWSREGILSVAFLDDPERPTPPWNEIWRDVPIVYRVLPLGERLPALPKVLSADMPYYPNDALELQVEGDVVFSVSTDGTAISDVRLVDFVSSSDFVPGGLHLAAAAQVNLRSWELTAHTPQTFQVVFRYRIAETLNSDANREVIVLRLPRELEVTALPFAAESN